MEAAGILPGQVDAAGFPRGLLALVQGLLGGAGVARVALDHLRQRHLGQLGIEQGGVQ